MRLARIRPSGRILAFAFLLASASMPAFATTLSDPIEGVSPDIVSLTATYDASYLYVSAEFDPGTFSSTNVGLLIGIDADRDATTGADNTPRFFPVGAEYSLFFNSLSAVNAGRFRLSQWVTSDSTSPVGYLDPVFLANEFRLAIPRSAIGGAGAVNFGLAAGNPTTATNFTPTDFDPDRTQTIIGGSVVLGVVVLGGPADTGTPSWAYVPNYEPVVVPEPSAAAWFAMAFTGLVLWRARRGFNGATVCARREATA